MDLRLLPCPAAAVAAADEEAEAAAPKKRSSGWAQLERLEREFDAKGLARPGEGHQPGVPNTGKSAKGQPATGKSAKGLLRGPATGRVAKGVSKSVEKHNVVMIC